jgi:hypothetical protein
VLEQIAEIPEQAWEPVEDYPDTGICQLAETCLGDERLIVRRVHLHAQEGQTELFACWRHFAFVPNRTAKTTCTPSTASTASTPSASSRSAT